MAVTLKPLGEQVIVITGASSGIGLVTARTGTVNGCQAAIARLAKQGGALITVASIVSDMPAPFQGAYAASKHAVKAYVESLRMELADDGLPIQVTLIKPSGIDTPIGRHAVNHESGEAQGSAADLRSAARRRRDPRQRRPPAARDHRRWGRQGAGVVRPAFPRALRSRDADSRTHVVLRPPQGPAGPERLKWGVGAGEERSGEYLHRRRTSLYTAASLHPKTTAAGLAGLALAGGLLFARRQRV